MKVSTEGYGEQHGESSLPIDEFTSRLYIFHYDVTDWQLHNVKVPEDDIARVRRLIENSWGRERL